MKGETIDDDQEGEEEHVHYKIYGDHRRRPYDAFCCDNGFQALLPISEDGHVMCEDEESETIDDDQ